MNNETAARIAGLLERIVPACDGLYRLVGPIGPSEYQALKVIAEAGDVAAAAERQESQPFPVVPLSDRLLRSEPQAGGCLCIDFGTAASKVGYEPGGDRFEPLAIGDGGDPFWVQSLIAIDDDGIMVFGERARVAGERLGRPVIASFKSKLWGDPALLDATALVEDGVAFSYRDVIQAYLAFLTQRGARALAERAEAVGPYVARRYAMPFAYDEGRRDIRQTFGVMLGRAAMLADTFGEALASGIDARQMRAALDAVALIDPPAWFLAPPACVGEPVAAGAFAMDEEIGQLTVYMIADVGAGTTDFCILCLKKRADGEMEPLQIRNGALSVEIAGDAVDTALVDFLVEEQVGEAFRAPLAAEARGFKERLFGAKAAEDEQFDHELLPDRTLVNVSRQDFLNSRQWRAFEDRLSAAQARCFDQADRTYLQNFGGGAIRVVVTGGGSFLPLWQSLAEGRSSGDVEVGRVFVRDFPQNIRNRFPDNIADLPRLAVALGGCRDTLPDEYDRTEAQASPGFTAPYVAAPFDKTKTGFEEE